MYRKRMRSPATFKKNLRADDFYCLRCRVQVTREGDHICGWCKSMGKLAEPIPKAGWRSEIRLDLIWAKRLFFGLGG